MTTLQSINPENFASDGLPIFFGDPNTKPDPVLPEFPWVYFCLAHQMIYKRFQRDPTIQDFETLRRFIEAAFIIPDLFEQMFEEWSNDLPFNEFNNPDQAWDGLITRLRRACPIARLKNPQQKPYLAIDRQISNHQDKPGREITRKPIVRHGRKDEKTEPTIKKKTTTRGLKWRLDPRWDKLTPCAIAVFIVLCLRTIWPKKLTSFPWAFGGVGKWVKGQGYVKGSLPKITGYSVRQCQYALRQLQGYGMIKKINRGYEGHGVSKFYVFFTPEMSKAFTALSKHKPNKAFSRIRKNRMN